MSYKYDMRMGIGPPQQGKGGPIDMTTTPTNFSELYTRIHREVSRHLALIAHIPNEEPISGYTEDGDDCYTNTNMAGMYACLARHEAANGNAIEAIRFALMAHDWDDGSFGRQPLDYPERAWNAVDYAAKND